jgi:cytochrome c-type biogenesis protein CcmE
MRPKYRRLQKVLLGLAAASVGLGAILYAFNDSLVFFYTPTQLVEKLQSGTFDAGRAFRIGGIVEEGSISSLPDGGIRFVITDLTNERPVIYKGMVPSLFRENQGVVAQGVLDEQGVMLAATILAKHDEKYMPREVVEALKASGRWREDGGYKSKKSSKP